MKLIFIISLMITASMLSQNKENQNDIYLLYEKSNELISKNLSNKKFEILKYNFKTKKQQDEYLWNNKKVIEPKHSFYFNFYYYKKPTKVENISNFMITSIESISKGDLIIKHRTKVYFIEKIDCKSYLIFETHMDFNE